MRKLLVALVAVAAIVGLAGCQTQVQNDEVLGPEGLELGYYKFCTPTELRIEFGSEHGYPVGYRVYDDRSRIPVHTYDDLWPGERGTWTTTSNRTTYTVEWFYPATTAGGTAGEVIWTDAQSIVPCP